MDMESLGIFIVVGSFLAEWEWARDPIARLLVRLRRHRGSLMLKGIVQDLRNRAGGGLTPFYVTGRSWRRREYLRVSAPRGRPSYGSTQLRRSDLSARFTA